MCQNFSGQVTCALVYKGWSFETSVCSSDIFSLNHTNFFFKDTNFRKTKSEYEYKSHKYVYFLLVHRKTVEKKLMKKIKMIEKKKEEKQIKKKWIDYKVYKRRNSLKSCHDLEVIDNMHVIVVIREKIGI